ncbi:OsmC family protein [Halomarina pelagica]|uniref:OsmC family protein n=1 Tax=Halomarina pelagica TaxID=2961599 RepID=UPI0020C2F59E|nr:OsmC family protein [Halomarina sp. BND7]
MTETTQREARIEQGVDLENLGAFLDYAEANPADVQFELGAVGTYEGRAIHTRAKTGPYALGGGEIDRVAREYTYHFGGHREVEEAVGFVDPTDRREVIETALAALSGCLNAAISMSAIAQGVDLDELETTVRIEWDPFVFLWLEDVEGPDGAPRDMFGDLRVEIEVSGENVDETTLDEIREWTGRSAVYNLVTLPHRCEPEVRLK